MAEIVPGFGEPYSGQAVGENGAVVIQPECAQAALVGQPGDPLEKTIRRVLLGGGDRPPINDTIVRFPLNGGANVEPTWISRLFVEALIRATP